MSWISEFREFAVKGNVVDMAVGIIIGAAFVNDIIMPPIGLLIGGVDFKDLAVILKEAVGETAAVTLNYGSFIQTLIDFLIIAAAIFVAIKVMNELQRKEEAKEEPAAPPVQETLLREIRDLLKQQR